MKVEIYVVNQGSGYEYYALQYVGSDICIKEFNTRKAAERYAKKNGYEF